MPSNVSSYYTHTFGVFLDGSLRGLFSQRKNNNGERQKTEFLPPNKYVKERRINDLAEKN